MQKRCLVWCLSGVLVAFSALSCGVKGPPTPADSIVPRAVRDLSATSRDGVLVLTWSHPLKNTDGSKLEDLSGYTVLQAVVEESAEEKEKKKLKQELMQDLLMELRSEIEGRTSTEKGEVIPQEDVIRGLQDLQKDLEETRSELDSVKDDLWAMKGEIEGLKQGEKPLGGSASGEGEEVKVRKKSHYRVLSVVHLLPPPEGPPLEPVASFEHNSVEYGATYEYQIVSFNSSNFESPPSNTLTIQWEAPPSPPSTASGKSADRMVELTWYSPTTTMDGNLLRKTELLGYNIYRRTEGEGFGFAPINTSPVPGPPFVDGGITNDKEYWYVVRAIRRVGKLDLEGKSSVEMHLRPTDTVAPSSPSALRAIPRTDGIFLHWNPPSDTDVAGYLVYRREKEAGDFIRITPQPIQVMEFLDTEVTPGRTYLYAVSAIDSAPQTNESPFSELAEASLP